MINLDVMHYCAREESIRRHPSYILIRGNLCDAPLMDFILRTYRVTHVIHFAAQSHVQNSFEDSLPFTHDNILGTHTLLEACRRYGSSLPPMKSTGNP